ncbi:MAG: ABC transporter ATP-binding protein [Planctomycetota bacterium]
MNEPNQPNRDNPTEEMPYVVLDSDPERPAAPSRAGIELRGVHKRFGNNHVLRGLDLVIEHGKTSVIIGGSGTGKSVTLKHMVGILKPNSGRIYVDGEDITDFNPKQLVPLRRKFGYLFQSTALISWLSSFENVALPLRELTRMSESEIEHRVMTKLKMLQVEKAAKLRPSQISGGMKKRVGLARALIWDPEFVLFDEPTSGLDPIMTAIVDEMITEAKDLSGCTSVVVSHDMASARRVGDKIIMMFEGRVIEQGPPDEFMESENPFVQQFVRGELEGPITERVRELEQAQVNGARAGS